MGEALANFDREFVHVFHRHRNDSRADYGGDASPCRLGGIETEQHRTRALGGAEQPHCRLGHDAELAFGTDHEAEPIEPARIEMRSAEIEDFAVQRHETDAQHVVGRYAVFQAMRAARVHADVAADRAGELRGWVRRIEKAFGDDSLGNREVGDAGFDAGVAIGEVYFENAAHLGEADDDCVLLRNGAARQRRPGAARHDVDADLAAIFQHPRDLLGRSRQSDRERRPAIGGQSVGLESAPLDLVDDQAFLREEGETLQDRVAPGEDADVGGRKGDLRHGVAPRIDDAFMRRPCRHAI